MRKWRQRKSNSKSFALKRSKEAENSLKWSVFQRAGVWGGSGESLFVTCGNGSAGRENSWVQRGGKPWNQWGGVGSRVFDRSREAPPPLTKGKERCVVGDAGMGVGTWRWESECLLSCCNAHLSGLASQSVFLTHIPVHRRTGFLSGAA